MSLSVKLCAALFLLTVCMLANPSEAQTTQPAGSTDAVTPQNNPLDQFKVLKVITNVDSWIKRGQTSQVYLPVYTDDVSGVKITIRLDGTRFGTGEVLAPNPLLPAIGDIQTGERLNLMKLTQLATDLALEDARRTFERRRMQIKVVNQVEAENQGDNLLEPIDPDKQDKNQPNVKNINFANISSQLTFDIQFALQPRRLLIKNIREVPANIRLGIEGMALTANGRWAFIFPGDAITMNQHHLQQHQGMIDGLIGKLKLQPNVRAMIGTTAGPVPYEFDVVQIVKHHPLSEPKALFRSQKSLPITPLDPAAIDSLILRQTKNLLYWQDKQGRYTHIFNAIADREATDKAPLKDAALVTYVLSLLESRLSVKDLADQVALKNEKGLVRILMDMGLIEDPSLPKDATVPGRDKADMASTALTLMALIQSPKLSGYQKAREELTFRLLQMQNPDGWFRSQMIANARLGNRNLADFAGQALAAYALTLLFDFTKNPEHRKAAMKAIDAIYSRVNDDSYFSTTPWLQLAEFNLTLKGEKLPGTTAYLKKYGPGLWNIQITPKLARAGYFTPDAVGGFYLRKYPLKEPTWLSARFLGAQVAAWPLLTDSEKKQWREGMLLGARYLDQLTLRDEDIFFIRDKRKALGSMRTTTFDTKLNLSTTAMGLMSLILIREKVQ